MSHDDFLGNTYKYLFSGVDVASRYGVAKSLTTKKSSDVSFVLRAIHKKGSLFKYLEVFQSDDGPEFKGDVTKLFENTMLMFEEQQQNISIPIQPLWRSLTKSWENCCLNQWMLKSSRTLKMYQQFESKMWILP